MRNTCSICDADLSSADWGVKYPGVLCDECERRAKGKAGEPFDPNAAPEVPWFVDGHPCWYRSRGDSGNMLRDYADIGAFWPFMKKCISGDWGRDLHRLAVEALAHGGPIPEAFGKKDSKAYTGADLRIDDETWAVCRGAQVPSAARLLDTAVAFKMKKGARYGVAILQPPVSSGDHGPADPWFVARYQAAVWQAFDIAFIQEGGTDADAGNTWRLLPALPLHTPFLDDLVSKIRDGLAGNAIPEDFVHESRDAEAVVRPVVHRILGEMQYRHVRTSYESMWRGASTDGSWENARAKCARIALEVKLQEDLGNPLCQPLDYFGAGYDAVIQVRLVNASTRAKIAQLPRELGEAVDAAKRRLPFRSIEIDIP
jgi:hypothetical protein